MKTHGAICTVGFSVNRRNSLRSPHVRGKEDRLQHGLDLGGITLACAGKSVSVTLFDYNCQDHPRVCGEKQRGDVDQCSFGGSPPRVRGKVCRRSPARVNPWITLACAGKSTGCSCVPSPPRDHPRVCGEKFPVFDVIAVKWGSPPRVRGKDDRTKAPQDAPGITPACAGKRLGRSSLLFASKDHPRVCREKLEIPAALSPEQGSPPRVRGKGYPSIHS